jgi:DUF917 family protein
LRDITADDIESLAVGAWVLGTGGGGNPYLPLLNMRALYREGHRVQLMDAADLADDDWVGTVANMGAPLVGQERLTDSRTIARAVELMEQHIGHGFRGIMSLEIGGGNSIQPLMAAAHLERPVIDSDMMGRAYPEAQMTSVAVGDLKPCPLTSVDVRGLHLVGEALRLDVGVVERPVADLDRRDRRARRRALGEELECQAVERAFAQAATEGD